MARLFTLQIRLGNDAMQSGDHLSDAVRTVADELYGPWDHDGSLEGDDVGGILPTQPQRIRDINGNTVGAWIVEEGPTGSGKDAEAAAIKRWARAGFLKLE